MRHPLPLAGAALGLLLSVAAPAGPAHATQFVPVSLKQLGMATEAVVRARVVSVESRWSDDGEVIVTYATLEVSRSLRGGLFAGERIVVKELGGSVDGFAVAAIGFPQFNAGDELVVFLGRWDDDGNYRVAEYGQGIFRVKRQKSGDEVLDAGPVQDSPDHEEVPVRGPIAVGTTVDALFTQLKSIR